MKRLEIIVNGICSLYVPEMTHGFRVRDPIHDLIVFDRDGGDGIDATALKLIDTPEFQRLRRIKQLGVSEFVYPGATHTRFSHSLGVFHNARKIMKVVHRLKADDENAPANIRRRRTVLLAALLHDLGHGPFSHAFEDAQKAVAKRRGGTSQSHEAYTAAIIGDHRGRVFPILEDLERGLAEEISALLRAEDPSDLYHAIVSSSFDADRMDYFERDRYMTGAKAGSIDTAWLLNNLTIHQVALNADEAGDEPELIETFAFSHKAQQAAEDFLLARYRLFRQVYLHKTTRGIEQLVKAIFLKVAEASEAEFGFQSIGLSADHPLIVHFNRDEFSTENFLRLDDAMVWGALEQMSRSADRDTSRLASALLNRNKPMMIDLALRCEGEPEVLINFERQIEQRFRDQIGITVFKDDPTLNLYGQIGDDREREHKKVRVVLGGRAREITDLPGTVVSPSLAARTRIVRFYFLEQTDYEVARRITERG